MAKIVVNRCYGGFGLSDEALKQLIAENSPVVDACPEDEYYGLGTHGRPESLDDFLAEEREKYSLLYEESDAGDGYIKRCLTLFKDGVAYSYRRRKYRDDSALVRVVEEMGDAANGPHAKLRVVEIPDGVEWQIEEHDGLEHIAEVHRTW